ncbi:hypothetical protein IVA93_37495 (plasmid) [Bradyrhizobium sp. 155]|uniref:hypothetical protein n=1 Tax=Bradyrhizobium sp. 155 TaxID=2782629 RepID=UPI001FFFE30C|nr:hypothetical protein [Bradyrhizobium sp. 155]UPK15807.1 hypothetical protein IVA93_37495 [Bradyrhizobium sp. 155]
MSQEFVYSKHKTDLSFLSCYLNERVAVLSLFYLLLDYVALFGLAVDLFVIHMAIYAMRRNHPGEVYVIWYACSFFFILFFGLTLLARVNGIGIYEICGTHKETCQSIYDHLTDPKGEIAFLGVMVGLALGPQLMTYLISALWGTASAPKFVRHIQAIAVWSLVKFLAGLGGIVISQSLAVQMAGTTLYDENIPRIGILPIFAIGASSVAAAFMIAAIYTMLNDAWDSFLEKHAAPPALMDIHKWCTRHVPKSSPYSMTRRALITLLESDAVFEYMADHGSTEVRDKSRSI